MARRTATNGKSELTLRDRLSHMTFRQACKLLGGSAEQLIRRGGQYEIDIANDVYMGGDLFRLRLNGAVVTITPMAEANQRLHWNCTWCRTACEHVGAAFAFVDRLLPAHHSGSKDSQILAEAVKDRLGECLEQDEQGRLKLTVTLPDAAALDNLAGSLARLLDLRPK